MKSSIPVPPSLRILISILLAAIMVAPAWTSRSGAEPTGVGIVLNPGTPSAGWAQLYRRDRATPTPIRLPRSEPASTVGLSPDGSLVAHDLNHTGDSGLPRDDFSNYEVVVADTVGRSVAGFFGGVRFAWSPDGRRLAVGIGCEPWRPIPPFDSIVVWEPSRGITLSRHVPASRGLIGWAGSDTLLIGSSVLGPAHAVACNTGTVGPSNHRGTGVSPDGLYSIYPKMGGIGLGVYDDRTGADFTYSLVELLHLPKLGDIGPAYWVRSSETDHALVLSACTPRATSGIPEWFTELVDVRQRRLLGWARGRLIGVTADSREAVVRRDGSYGFLGEGDWERGSLPTGGSPAMARDTRRTRTPYARGAVFAFTAQQIWCCDNSRLATALGYRTGTVYVLGADGRSRELLSNPDGLWPSEAALNRSADLVGITASGGDGITALVADTSGAIVARFPGRSRFRWSPDGSHLALIGSDLLIWSRREGNVRSIPLHPDDEAWTSAGTLMLRLRDRIVRLDWRSGDTTGTAHQAVALSPDGDFSIDAVHAGSGPRVFDDHMHAEITACTWGDVHALGWGLSGDPFWSVSPELRHHLWINKCDERLLGMEEGKLSGCEVALVDVQEMELMGTIPGKLIGRTADERHIVLLREDSLVVVPLDVSAVPARPRVETRATEARIRAVVEEWSSKGGGGRSDTVGVYVLAVKSGDWLPDWSDFGLRCDRGMRVRRVTSRDQVDIDYRPGEFWTEPRPESEGVARVTPETPAIFSTKSYDAGRVIRLSIAPE
jgi:hypothetical protein